jgi:cytochrome subunit of sulfide dehydrogenase
MKPATTRFCLLIAASALATSQAGHAGTTPPIATGKMLGNTCAACHGTFGKSTDEYMPSLAGIDRQQMIRAMTDYRENRRVSVVMNRVAKGYNDAEIAAIADYFSKIK